MLGHVGDARARISPVKNYSLPRSSSSRPVFVWRSFRMRRTLAFSLSLFVVAMLAAFNTPAASPRALATITGSVRDNKGNPLAGALVSLLREGAKQVKEAKTDRNGNFIAKVLPGRYGIRA